LELKLIYHTPKVEELLATAVLTTCSKRGPISHFKRFSAKPDRVRKILKRVILKHGSVLEHNRFLWIVHARDDEILNLSVRHRFIEFSKLGGDAWLMSCNLRTMLEVIQSERGAVAEAMLDALKRASPTIYGRVVG